MKKISSTILKRLDALNVKTVGDVPDMTFIDREGEIFVAVEHYYSPRGNKYRRIELNSPDEYISKGGIVYHCYDLED